MVISIYQYEFLGHLYIEGQWQTYEVIYDDYDANAIRG